MELSAYTIFALLFIILVDITVWRGLFWVDDTIPWVLNFFEICNMKLVFFFFFSPFVSVIRGV